MDYDLFRIDYLISSVTYPDTLKILPASTPKTRQKFTIGDKNGILQCLFIKDEEPSVQFKTLPGKPITSVQVAGSLGSQADKIFAAAGNEVKGYTRKGKVFLTLETTLSETITSMYILGGDLLLGSGRIVTHYRDLRELHSYTCEDRVLDLTAFATPNGTRIRILVLIANKGVILLENGQVVARLGVTAGPVRLAVPPNQHGQEIRALYGAADGSIGLLVYNGPGLSSKCLMKGHDLGAVVCTGWWFSNNGTHLAVGRHDGSIQLYLVDIENLQEKPRLKYTYFCGEPVTSVSGGCVGAEEAELLAATFSGRVFALRPRRLIAFAAGPSGIASVPQDALTARRAKLEAEVSKLERQAANERERYQHNTRSIQSGVSQPPLLDVECELTGAEKTGWQEIRIMSAVPLDMLFLYSEIKLQLQSDNSAVLSLCSLQENASDLLATVRCQAGTRRLCVRVRHAQDQRSGSGTAQKLLVYALPAGAPRVARLITLFLPILPLYSTHEDPDVAEKENRPWCALRVSGGFSVAEMSSWLSTALPQELPRPTLSIAIARAHALLQTKLICRYQRGLAIIKSDDITTIAVLKDLISQCSVAKGIRIDISVDVPKNCVLKAFTQIEEEFRKEYQKYQEIILVKSLRLLDLDSNSLNEEDPQLCEAYKNAWLQSSKTQETHFSELVDTVINWYVDGQKLSLKSRISETEKSRLQNLLENCCIDEIKEIIKISN